MNIRRTYTLVTLFAMMAMTIGFIRRDLAWDGTWQTQQLRGRKTATISAPWPTNRWNRDSQTGAVKVYNESIYFTVAIPRAFERLDVRLKAQAPSPPEAGIEVIPHTLRYNIVPLQQSGSERFGSLNIKTVRQSSGKINVVLRFPNASPSSPASMEAIEFTFRRQPWSLRSLIIRLWQKFPL